MWNIYCHASWNDLEREEKTHFCHISSLGKDAAIFAIVFNQDFENVFKSNCFRLFWWSENVWTAQKDNVQSKSEGTQMNEIKGFLDIYLGDNPPFYFMVLKIPPNRHK